ncbi:hypothetical protein, partial [Erysipelothrix urinaevulpis]
GNVVSVTSANDKLVVKSKGNYADKEVGLHDIVIGIEGQDTPSDQIIGEVTAENVNPVIGDEFIIYTKDFNLNLEEAALHDKDLYKERSEVYVREKESFSVVDEAVEIGKDTVKAEFTPQGVYYEVGFYVIKDEKASTISKVTVDNLNKPVLSVPDFTVLQV